MPKCLARRRPGLGDNSIEQAALVDLAPFELALQGDRRKAATRLAALEWRSADRNPFAGYVTHPLHRAIGRLAAAEWLLAEGDTTQAASLLLWPHAFTGPFMEEFPMKPMVDLLLARLDEARGRAAQARAGYATFLTWYDLPSPAHRHLVEEAQSDLARLSGVPDPARDR